MIPLGTFIEGVVVSATSYIMSYFDYMLSSSPLPPPAREDRLGINAWRLNPQVSWTRAMEHATSAMLRVSDPDANPDLVNKFCETTHIESFHTYCSHTHERTKIDVRMCTHDDGDTWIAFSCASSTSSPACVYTMHTVIALLKVQHMIDRGVADPPPITVPRYSLHVFEDMPDDLFDARWHIVCSSMSSLALHVARVRRARTRLLQDINTMTRIESILSKRPHTDWSDDTYRMACSAVVSCEDAEWCRRIVRSGALIPVVRLGGDAEHPGGYNIQYETMDKVIGIINLGGHPDDETDYHAIRTGLQNCTSCTVPRVKHAAELVLTKHYT